MVGLDAAVAMVDTGVAVVVGLDDAVAMVRVSVTVLVISVEDADGDTMEDGARMAATIAGMSSVVRGRRTVVEHRLRFDSGAFPKS